MPLLKRKKNIDTPEEYKPALYPSFQVRSSDGIKLSIKEDDIGKDFTATVKLMGINKRSKIGKVETDWSFEVQSLN